MIRPKGNTDEVITSWDAKHGFEGKVFAAEVTATRPTGIAVPQLLPIVRR